MNDFIISKLLTCSYLLGLCILLSYTDNLLGELNNIDDVNTDRCLECISSNKETVVGIKIRLTAKIANDGKNEREAFR